jgi:RNA 2',3'-cyclic 3'-phosphodiesterase
MMRLFVALPLPHNVKEILQQQQETLRSHLLDSRAVKFVSPQNFHLTLRFFGDVPAEQENDLMAALQNVCENFAPLHLNLSDAGCFPNARRPRVAWTGVGGEIEKLRALQAQISQATAQFGEPPESRPYAPHLTLARVQNGMRETQLESALQILNEQRAKMSWLADEVALYQSVLLRSGAEYSIRARWQLG